jgi:hypothetical protein
MVRHSPVRVLVIGGAGLVSTEIGGVRGELLGRCRVATG